MRVQAAFDHQGGFGADVSFKNLAVVSNLLDYIVRPFFIQSESLAVTRGYAQKALNFGVGTGHHFVNVFRGETKFLTFNTRQNGYDMSADALGYPESYYIPPAQAVEKIEVDC